VFRQSGRFLSDRCRYKVKPERNSFDVVGEALSRTTCPEIDTVKLPKKTDAEHNGIFNLTIHKLSRRPTDQSANVRQIAT
jgi:hypothetical protein